MFLIENLSVKTKKTWGISENANGYKEALNPATGEGGAAGPSVKTCRNSGILRPAAFARTTTEKAIHRETRTPRRYARLDLIQYIQKF